MKCKIPEISWHNRDPVLSVDIQPKTDKSSLSRLASGGTDSHVLIWSILFTETGEMNLDVAADLTRHQKAVNVVKWSPNGEYLASGDDESIIFIWKQKEESEPINILDSANEHDKEIWITLKALRGHMEDIYDLSWSPNSQFLVSGSVDNTAIIWDVHKGKSISILNDHKGFVQGVAWDPKNQYIATLSTDRYLRIFDIQTKKVVHRVSKSPLPVSKENELHDKKVRLYHDDTLQTFFRRLCFSPDGKLLFTPSGVIDYDGATNILHSTYIYSRYSLKQPSIVLPSDQFTVAVKCCPILFKLRNKAESFSAVIPLPYRMIFAIATKSSVYLYDTQQKVPFGLISNIHYTRLTDISWSSDGRIIIVSSTDGFCSVITFDEGELGEEYEAVHPRDSINVKKDEKIEIESIKKSNESNSTKGDTTLESLQENEIVIVKDIISSDEKFQSPEKKSLPATPISVRRHPRTPTTTQSSNKTDSIIPLAAKSSPIAKDNLSVLNSNKGSEKKATPIAVRRKPRVLIPTAVEKTAIVEEAMDAWPLKSETDKNDEDIKEDIKSSLLLGKPASDNNECTNGCTEDIRLVYEETVEETPLKEASIPKQGSEESCKVKKSKNIHQTPENKTPRRVELKTISTPKSKKKLLE